MIIVEGPDGAGKSTLVKSLCQMYGLTVGERGTKNRDLLYTVTVPDTMRALSCAVHGNEASLVWDRLYYSDFVYAPLQRRPVAFSAVQQAHIDAVIEAIRCPIIVCLPPFEVAAMNSAKVHQMTGVEENFETIYNHYRDMCYRVGDASKPFPDHRVVYDYTDDDTHEQVFEEIEDYLDNRQERLP